VTGQEMSFMSPLSEDMAEVIHFLREKAAEK
jgi:hypothetical protein